MVSVRSGRRTASLATVLLVFSLAGCSTLGLGSTPKPDDIFDLAAPTAFDGSTRRSSAQILVPLPNASDALSSARIAVRADGGSISYLPGVSWSDELPPLIQTIMVRAFENSGRVKAVGKPGESLAIDDQVIVDIRAFELDVTGSPAAHVTLGVKLLDERNGKVRASKVFDVSRPAASDRPKDAITAIDQAASAAVAEVVVWTAGAL
ncbi:ABC-type transport auxiliary lipoprotein family protein [Pleomorphomonas diazotrophica]|uniref:ABC-type transport auxiliary lipoprotein family protein n=1 Tax=Pleomorphomonas diazotrophica TaxID=1166257 RepID=UPI0015D608C1|nr:ABC-type transport auxiliary lipoprotein family protein [Pleomorphomonas diazotrophica]